jgi:hypothetical protein
MNRSPNDRGSGIAQTLCALALLAITLALPTTTEAAPKLTISFETRAVVVTGATPHSDVILLGVTREPRLYSAHTVIRRLIRTDVPNAPVRFDFDGDLALASLYAAVDTRTGAYAIGTPPGFPLRLHDISPLAFRKNGSDILDLTLPLHWVEALCVRPGGGSWNLSTLEGAANDGDSTPNGHLVIAPVKMHGNSSAPGLQRFTPHDVIIILDPDTLTAYATEVAQ